MNVPIKDLKFHVDDLETDLLEHEMRATDYKTRDTLLELNFHEVWNLYQRSVTTLHAALICPLCLESTADRATYCGPQFCEGCIIAWAKIRNTCPNCRVDLYTTTGLPATIKLRNLDGLRDESRGIAEAIGLFRDNKIASSLSKQSHLMYAHSSKDYARTLQVAI